MKGLTLVRIFSIAMLLFASQEGLMSQTIQEQKVRNVVLVHGGFVDGSGWEGVYKNLTEKAITSRLSRTPQSRLRMTLQ